MWQIFTYFSQLQHLLVKVTFNLFQHLIFGPLFVICLSKMINWQAVYNSYLRIYSDFDDHYFPHFVCKSSDSTTHEPYQMSRTCTCDPSDIDSDTALRRVPGCLGRTCQVCCSCSRLFHHRNKYLSHIRFMIIK